MGKAPDGSSNILRQQLEELCNARSEATDAQGAVEKYRAHVRCREQVFHVLRQFRQLINLALVLSVDRVQLFVDGMQLLVRALKFFIGGNELFVGGL